MKVYSRSAGQVIDVPDQGASTGAPMSPMDGSSMDPETMRKLFAITALKNPKQASSITSIFNLLQPKETAVQAKRKSATGDIDKGLAEIERARTALKKSGSGLKYIGYGAREKFGDLAGITKKATDANAALSSVNTQLFKIAGTQFPKNEEALLGGIVLGIDKGYNSNLSALDEAERRLINTKKALSGGFRDEQSTQIDAFEQQSKPRLSGAVKAGLPIAGGAIGTAAGGPALGILGATGGTALATLLQRMIGDPEAPKTVGEQAATLGKTAATEAIGQGVGAGMRAVANANPIGWLDDLVATLSKRSTGTYPKENIMNKFTEEVLKKIAPGNVDEGLAIAEKITSQMPDTYLNAPGYSGEQLNTLRKTFTDKFGGQDMLSQMQNVMRRYVREGQLEAVPNVRIPLALEKLLIDIPDIAKNLPLGIGNTVSKVLPLLTQIGRTGTRAGSRILPGTLQGMMQ